MDLICRSGGSKESPLIQNSNHHGLNQISVALANADLEPAGLPPQAIFIVRRLSDSTDGLLLSGSPWSAGRLWGKAIRPQLDDMWRQARRPFVEPVGANTPAVWFLNRAEWLACLTLDLARGVAAQRWWWQTALRPWVGQAAPKTCSAVWEAYPETLPEMIGLLQSRHAETVLDLLTSLSSSTLQALSQKIALYFRLPAEWISYTLPEFYDPHNSRIPGGKLSPVSSEVYRFWVLTLGLYHAPTYIKHSLTIADGPNMPPPDQLPRSEVLPTPPTPKPFDLPSPHRRPEDIWLETVNDLHQSKIDVPVADSPSPEPSNRQMAMTLPHQFEQPQNDLWLEDVGVPPEKSSLAGNVDHLTKEELPDHPDSTSSDNTLIGPIQTEQTPMSSPYLSHDEIYPKTAPLPIPVDQYGPTSNPSHPLSPITETMGGYRTTLGGLWFLINILLFFDWLDKEGSLWAQLDALGRLLWPDTSPNENIWPLLARLAWLDGVESLPGDDAIEWAAAHLPRIEDWLSTRLSIPIDKVVLAAMLEKPAVIYLSTEEINVVFDIEEIDLRCRFAGIDRDPGWSPELPCAIRFHFV